MTSLAYIRGCRNGNGGAWILLMVLLSLVSQPATTLAQQIPVRIGDPGSVPDPTRFDPRIPEMAEWAKAGVEGGVPVIERIVARLKPGVDLQAEIDKAGVAEKNPGVLLLTPGTYDLGLNKIRLRPGLILRGEDRDATILSSQLADGDHVVTVAMANHSALEDLTILNAVVKSKVESTYQGQYKNFGAPANTLVGFHGTRNAWMQRCNLFWAGSHPIDVGNASHATFRDNFVSKAYNKGGQGNGYIHFGTAEYLLFYNERYEDIRHVSIMWKAHYVVIYKCRFNVDINYHDGLPYGCLVEETSVQRRGSHHWSAICFGWPPWQKVGPGPRNFLWNNNFDDAGGGNRNIWVLRDTSPGYANMAEKEPMILDFGPPPKGGTLYAVTGKHVPFEEVQRARCMADLQAAVKAGTPAKVVLCARLAMKIFAPKEPQHQAARQELDRMETAAATALSKLGGAPTPAVLVAFRTTWQGTQAETRARELAGTLAQSQYNQIAPAGQKPADYHLRKFVADWREAADIGYAVTTYENMAEGDYTRNSRTLTTSTAIQAFIAKWPGTAAAQKAAVKLNDVLRAELADIVARKAKLSSGQLKSLARKFEGTPLEKEAREALVGK